MFSIELNLTRSWCPVTFFCLRETQRGHHDCRPQKEPAKRVFVVVPLPTFARSISTVFWKNVYLFCTSELSSIYIRVCFSVYHFSCSFWVISKKRRGKHRISHLYREPGEHFIFSPTTLLPSSGNNKRFYITLSFWNESNKIPQTTII